MFILKRNIKKYTNAFVSSQYKTWNKFFWLHDIHLDLKYFRCVDPSPHQLFPGDQCGTGSSSCRSSAPTGTSLQSRRDMKPPSQPPALPDHNPGALKCILGTLADICLVLKQSWTQECGSRARSRKHSLWFWLLRTAEERQAKADFLHFSHAVYIFF